MDQIKNNAEISRRILAAIAGGMTLQQSFDAVMGNGKYEELASEVYNALRAK